MIFVQRKWLPRRCHTDNTARISIILCVTRLIGISKRSIPQVNILEKCRSWKALAMQTAVRKKDDVFFAFVCLENKYLPIYLFICFENLANVYNKYFFVITVIKNSNNNIKWCKHSSLTGLLVIYVKGTPWDETFSMLSILKIELIWSYTAYWSQLKIRKSQKTILKHRKRVK